VAAHTFNRLTVTDINGNRKKKRKGGLQLPNSDEAMETSQKDI